jgi:hypothetical protein
MTRRAEPTNPHDSFAVEIMHGPAKLGYLPRYCSRQISRLLQADAPLTRGRTCQNGEAVNSKKLLPTHVFRPIENPACRLLWVAIFPKRREGQVPVELTESLWHAFGTS